MISLEQILTKQKKKINKMKAQHLHCPHMKSLAFIETLYKLTGHTLQIFKKIFQNGQ